MKWIWRIILLAGTVCLLAPVGTGAQTAGPYYFVSDNVNGNAQFYGNRDSYSGITVIEGYNLLAAVLGDVPQPASGQTLVPAHSFDFGSGTISLQPFAYTLSGSSKKYNLPAGPNLKNFLNDPLSGGKFDLTLPFWDENVALSDRSALMREQNDVGTWHTSIDFDMNGNTTLGFDVIAAADGVVEKNSDNSGIYVIKHTSSGGKQFLTIYQHLLASSKNSLVPGDPIKRGAYIGKVREMKDADGNPGYSHLHFTVAVRGPQRTIGTVTVPELWYLVDPFGVFDYRRNSGSTTLYNYLPHNTLSFMVRPVIHKYMFRTNPPAGSLRKKGEMEIGESKTVTVSASNPYDLTGIYMRSGQTFQFTTESPGWNNGDRETDCDGYPGTMLDALRRHPDLNMMVLTGELFKENNSNNYTGHYFRIGCGPRTHKVTKSGYLVCFANDILAAYSDNSRVVTLTVKRTD